MATENTTGLKTFTATAVAIEAFVRVVLDASGTIAAAGATDLGIGVTQEAIAASGQGTVKLFSAAGTFLIQAAGPVTKAAQVYTAAAGEVDDSGTYKLNLVAVDTATAQGDVIECAKIADASSSTNAYAGADVGTIAAAGSDQAGATLVTHRIEVVSGASGANGARLPVASAGAEYVLYSSAAANALLVYPATSGTINDGTANASVSVTARRANRFIGTSATNWALALI